MVSVAEQEDTNFESLEDSLIDMINYCAMYGAWVENQRLEDQDAGINNSAYGRRLAQTVAKVEPLKAALAELEKQREAI